MIEEYIGFIYEWINKINGRKYIGKHKGHIADGYIGSGKYFLRAYKKYGKENFERTILEYVNTTDKDLMIREEFWLKETNAPTREDYYNISAVASGGCTTAGYTKEYICKYMQKVVDRPEWREKQKTNHYKATRTKEWKDALMQSKSMMDTHGHKNPKFRGYWITPYGKFDSQNKAAEHCGISFITIRNRCLHPNHIIKQVRLPKDWYNKTWSELGWGFEPATPTISPKIKKIYIKKNYADLYNRLNENTTDVGS